MQWRMLLIAFKNAQNAFIGEAKCLEQDVDT